MISLSSLPPAIQPLAGLFIKGQSLLGKKTPPAVTRCEVLGVNGFVSHPGSGESYGRQCRALTWYITREMAIMVRPGPWHFPFCSAPWGSGCGANWEQEGLLLSTPSYLTPPTETPRALLPDLPTPNKDTHWGRAGGDHSDRCLPQGLRWGRGDPRVSPRCSPSCPPSIHLGHTVDRFIQVPLWAAPFSLAAVGGLKASRSPKQQLSVGVSLPPGHSPNPSLLLLREPLLLLQSPQYLPWPWLWSQGAGYTKVLMV